MALPTPYYQEGGITIYHGDCREILPDIPAGSVDLVLTDPPYGIGGWSATGGNSLTPSECQAINRWDTRPSDSVMLEMISRGRYAIVWGGQYFGLWPSRAPLIWDKGIRGMHFADGEMAWTNFDFGTLRIYNGPIEHKGARVHPTQKPESLMKWCINLVSDAKSVFDPFAGSGSALVAAQLCSCTAIGIEIEERYCEIAANRLAQGVFDFRGTPDA